MISRRFSPYGPSILPSSAGPALPASSSIFSRRTMFLVAMRPKLWPHVGGGSNVFDHHRRVRRQLDGGADQHHPGIGGEQHVTRGSVEPVPALGRSEVAPQPATCA